MLFTDVNMSEYNTSHYYNKIPRIEINEKFQEYNVPQQIKYS